MGGMGMQQGFLTCFILLTILFYRKMRTRGNTRQTEWRWILYMIYTSIALITVRIIYRFVEFSSGFDGPVPHTESLFYVFDSVPMLTAIVMFNVYHPGRVLVGPESEFQKMSSTEKKEAKSAESTEKQIAKGEKRWLKQGNRKTAYSVLQNGSERIGNTVYEGASYEESSGGLTLLQPQHH